MVKRIFMVVFGLALIPAGLWVALIGSQQSNPSQEELETITVSGAVEVNESTYSKKGMERIDHIRFKLPKLGEVRYYPEFGKVEEVRDALRRDSTKELSGLKKDPEGGLDHRSKGMSFVVYSVHEIVEGKPVAICSYEDSIGARSSSDTVKLVLGLAMIPFGLFCVLTGTVWTHML